jgi:transcriptional regulator
MYNPPHFAVSDVAWAHDFIRQNAFATWAAVIDGAVHFAYAPLVLDREPAPLGTVYFHLARSNPVASLANGLLVTFSVMGAHTYISPDWYETPGQVPTWNYLAIEGSGRVHRLDETESIAHLMRLAQEQESFLAPKPAWSPSRRQPARLKQLLLGIVPFASLLIRSKARQSCRRTGARPMSRA